MRITHHAGIGRSPGEIFINKVVDDEITEFFPYIQNEMRKSVLHCSHAGVIETIQVTASCFFFAATAGSVVPGFHGDAHHFISLIVEHESSNGTIDTTTHRDQNLSFTTHDSKKLTSCKFTA